MRSGRVLEGSLGVGVIRELGKSLRDTSPCYLRFSYVPTKALHRPFKGGAAKDYGGG